MVKERNVELVELEAEPSHYVEQEPHRNDNYR